MRESVGPHLVHPLFEHDRNGKNYDQNMTILDPKLRLKYDWCENDENYWLFAVDRKTRLKWSYRSNPLYSHYEIEWTFELQTIWTALWSNEKQLNYNDRNEVRVKHLKCPKINIFFPQKSNHFYDFF